MLTGERYTSTWKVKVACYDRQSEFCMRTHYICHPTVPFPALSHIPSPLLLLFQPSKLLKRYIHLRQLSLQLSLHLHIRPLRHLALVRPPRTGPGLAHTVGRAVVARAVQCAQEIQVQRPPGSVYIVSIPLSNLLNLGNQSRRGYFQYLNCSLADLSEQNTMFPKLIIELLQTDFRIPFVLKRNIEN